MTTVPNHRASLDAAVAFSLHFGGCWRRATSAMNNDYSVDIVARGEGIDYREGGRTLNFDLSWSRGDRHWVFHAYGCSDERFHPVHLSSDEEKQIVSRIVAYLESRGDRVQILAERPPQPLKSVAEIARERSSRGGTR